MAHYRQAIALGDEDAVIYLKLGNALRSLGKQAEAADAYRQGLRLEPEGVELHHNPGLTLDDLGDHEAALAELRRAAELSRTMPRRDGGSLMLMGMGRLMKLSRRQHACDWTPVMGCQLDLAARSWSWGALKRRTRPTARRLLLRSR